MIPSRKRPCYTRPCDECSKRKKKCDRSTSTIGICTNCIKFDRLCGDERGKLKSGPKPKNPGRSHEIYGKIPFEELAHCIRAFNTHMYVFFPVVSCDELISRIFSFCKTDPTLNLQLIALNEESALTYALCCSISAVVCVHFQRTASYSPKPLTSCSSSAKYVAEARQVVHEFGLDMNPTMETALMQFFLHVYYSSSKQSLKKGIICLREAISIIQLFGLHCETTYSFLPRNQAHLWRKIYYMILITERFQCFRLQCYQIKFDALLQASINFPTVEDDKHPDVLIGFVQLAQLFSAADIFFLSVVYGTVTVLHPELDKEMSLIQNIYNKHTRCYLTKSSMVKFQSNLLESLRMLDQVKDQSQLVNILLTKAWLQSLGWSASLNEKYIEEEANEACLRSTFPQDIATNFLRDTCSLPESAFTMNGPGICLKMLQLVDSLQSRITETPDQWDDWMLLHDRLFSLTQKIEKYKWPGYQIPDKLFLNIQTFEQSRSIPGSLLFLEESSVDKSNERFGNSDSEVIIMP